MNQLEKFRYYVHIAMKNFEVERDRAAWMNTITGIRILFFNNGGYLEELDDTDTFLLDNAHYHLRHFQYNWETFTEEERNVIISYIPQINEE